MKSSVLLYLSVQRTYAPVAQLDRVTDYESVGRGFESLPAYQRRIIRTLSQSEEGSDYLFSYRAKQRKRWAGLELSRILKAVFDGSGIIVFLLWKAAPKVLGTCRFLSAKCGRNAPPRPHKQGAAKLTAPCTIYYLLFPPFPSDASASHCASHSRNAR